MVAAPDIFISSKTSDMASPKSPNQMVRNFDGWDTYPLNLSSYNPLRENGLFYSSRLTEDSPRLLTADSNTSNVEFWDASFSTKSFEKYTARCLGDLESKLQSGIPQYNETGLGGVRIVIISQNHSFDRLKLSEEMLRKLLSFYQINPKFLDILHCFGRKQWEKDMGFSTFNTKPLFRDDSGIQRLEMWYNLRYVAKHGRPKKDPWSIRQMAVYHSFELPTNEHLWILVQPPLVVQKRIEEAISCGGVEFSRFMNQFLLHTTFLSSALENWRAHCNEFEERFRDFTEDVYHQENPTETDQSVLIKSSINSHHRLRQSFQEKLLKVLCILDQTAQTIAGFERLIDMLQSANIDLCLDTSHEYSWEFSPMVKMHQRNYNALLQRAQAAAAMSWGLKFANFLDFRNDSVINQGTESMNSLATMARLTRRETELMVDIAVKARRDSRTMRTATIIAMIYLPASFVASFFGMNFIDVNKAGNDIRLMFSTKLWLFFAMLVPLTGVTWATYYFWERRQDQVEAKEKEMEKGED